MIIAVDGPAASGKGTLARALAAHFGLNYLDTGTLYRMVALSVLQAGENPGDVSAAERTAKSLDVSTYSDADLRTARVEAAASKVAAIPEVREAVLHTQRDFARTPPGAVLDGRDIGTIVCPDADVKLFVTASAEVRARRRHEELSRRGEDTSFDAVLADLTERDERDAKRAIAPLKPAEDAHLLDSSDLSIEAAFRRAVAIIEAAKA
ncbi:MAG: (d)CMP kinase [Hyphomicrobiales bacterium]